ncbi:MAG: outer membrane protein assembly factor BamD [Candidatus Dasytiphilus stammeri]
MNNNRNNFLNMMRKYQRTFQSLIKPWNNTPNSEPFILESDSQQHKLNLIYIYYKQGNLVNAEKIIQKYIFDYPNQSNLDYVLYMRGLIYIRLDQYFWRKLFRLDLSNCNSEYARSALHDFSQLILSYPESKYTINARKHISALKERLANYDLLIANFYFQHRKYISVIHRIEKMMLYYPNTKYTKLALVLIKEAYKKISFSLDNHKVKKLE